MSKQTDALKHACEVAGSQAELARLIGLSPSMVNQMVKGSRPIPVEYCLAIEKATKGAVTRRELCEVWPRIWPLKDSTAKQKSNMQFHTAQTKTATR